ncbi:HopJ type III effector protein [Cellulophaga sp. 20_2_10]|uniref:HopJ type III effector protein n=1 Tax=Cellulophaga sp. 20_2_10 TaxID=2942476 RepID=UPI00201B1FC5|nr:HopJ type III effector protein [Cellulophaga sp. 20_2_10]MCL5246403.1 HopJ type III effector protein [Cellulophaga sp. 20_2_10]
MTLDQFKEKLQNNPTAIAFTDTMQVIEDNYTFTPTAFKNGSLDNKEGENSGSCKLFAFALKQELSKEETLACFGTYYREDVLQDPNGNGHLNIRNFMQTGFKGLAFSADALKEK